MTRSSCGGTRLSPTLLAEPFATAAVAQLRAAASRGARGADRRRSRARASCRARNRARCSRRRASVSRAPSRAADDCSLPLGAPPDALDAYQSGRRALSDQLGLQPSQELRNLQAAILRQDEALSIRGHANGSAAYPVWRERRASFTAPTGILRLAPRPSHTPAAALLLGTILALVAAVAALALRGERSAVTVLPNSVAVIDPEATRWSRSRSGRDPARSQRAPARSGSATSTTGR